MRPLMIREAEALYESGQTEEARQELAALIKKWPDAPEASTAQRLLDSWSK